MAEPPPARADRLAEALRSNLRRRKVQARALAQLSADPPPADAPAPPDEPPR